MNIWQGKLETEKKFTVTDIEPAVPENGIREVGRILTDKFPGHFNSAETALPTDFDLRWIVKDGEYTGTFPKRVSKWLYKEHGVDIGAGVKEQLGNAARKHTFTRSSYTYDFTANFGWRAGDFGDSGSCLWESRRGARAIMTANHCLAIRLWDEDKGIGRAWIAFPESRPDNIFMFNAYPKSVSLEQCAMIVSRHLGGLPHESCYLTNNGLWSGENFWINMGRAIIMGNNDGQPNDLRFSERVRCSFCSQVTGCCNTTITLDGCIACDRCAGDLPKCEACGAIGSLTFISGYGYCRRCESVYVSECPMCHLKAITSSMMRIPGSYYICTNCWNSMYFSCSQCGVIGPKSAEKIIAGHSHCPECWAACSGCGEAVTKRRLTDGLCYKCFHESHSMCRLCGRYYLKENKRCACRPKAVRKKLAEVPF
jgi:hypothetical protein